MPAALVQTKRVNGSGTSIAATFDSTPTAGNFIHVIGRAADEQFAATIFDDNKGNTYTITQEFERAAGNQQAAFGYAANITSSATFTITLHTAAGTDLELLISEWSGVATVSPFDVGAGQTDSTTDTLKESGNTAATSQADSIVICGGVDRDAGFAVWTAGSGYTLGLAGSETGLVYKVLSATGVQNGLIDCGHGFGVVDVRADVFKAAGGGGGGVKPKTLLTLGVG